MVIYHLQGESNRAFNEHNFGAQPHLCSSGYTSHRGEGWPRYQTLPLTEKKLLVAQERKQHLQAPLSREHCSLWSSRMGESGWVNSESRMLANRPFRSLGHLFQLAEGKLG